jgi:LCP family protein required for cell wall assembly
MKGESRRRFVGIVAGLLTAIFLGGCQTIGGSGMPQIFVGFSTATPSPTPAVSPTPAPTATATPEPRPFDFHQTSNLLVLGTDRRAGWTDWRTDSIMIVGLDREYGRAAVLSVPRDLYIEIPGYGQARINQVDYVGEKILKVKGGGPALVSQVISDTLGLTTDHWIRIELTGFRDFVDALGGVTVHLDCPFFELIYDAENEEWTYFELPAGDVLMDGETAYRFVTLRYLESDFGRSRRQRQFLWALRNKAITADLILRLPELWTAFQDTFSTDLSILQMLDLAKFGLSLSPENIKASALTGKQLERYITESGADVLKIADTAAVQALVDNIWDAPAMALTNRADPDACRTKPDHIPSYLSTIPGLPNATPAAPEPSQAEENQAGE